MAHAMSEPYYEWVEKWAGVFKSCSVPDVALDELRVAIGELIRRERRDCQSAAMDACCETPNCHCFAVARAVVPRQAKEPA